MALFLIYSIFIIAFFGNAIAEYGLIASYYTVVSELLVYLLFIYSILEKKIRNEPYRINFAMMYIYIGLVGIASVVANRYFNIQAVNSFRLLFRYYFFFLALINLYMNEKELMRINTLLFACFLVQLPISTIKFSIWGIRETTHGTHMGGTLTTAIPLIALGYLLGYYSFFKTKKLYLVLTVCFIFYGIVGAKAALLILFPISFAIIYYLICIKGKRYYLLKQLSLIIIIIGITMILSSLIIRLNVRLNPEKKVGGSVNFSYALQYTKDYTTNIEREKSSIGTGRFSTSKIVLEQMWKDGFTTFMLGYGPGSITKSFFGDPSDPRVMRIFKSYGKTGFAYYLTEYGLLGVATIFVILSFFIYRCWTLFSLEEESYWKSFSVGSLNFAIWSLLIFIFYSPLPIIGDLFPPLFFYVMSVTNIRLNRISIS